MSAHASAGRPVRNFRTRLGFSPIATPVIILMGLAFLMASVPGLFAALARQEIGPGYLTASLEFLGETARGWAGFLQSMSFNSVGDVALHACLLVIPVLWAAALIRSLRVRSWRPFVVTAAASLLGLIGIPIASWLGEAAVVLWRVAGYIADFVVWLWPWVVRVVLWAGTAIFGVVVIVGICYGVYSLIVYLHRQNRWTTFLLVVLAVGGLAGALWAGWFDDILAWLGNLLSVLAHWIERIVAWIAGFLVPLVRFIVRMFVIAVVFMLILGIAVGTLGQAGRTIYLPLISAASAGRDQGKCADLAAGSGVTMSLVLTAAVLDPAFSGWFSVAWQTTPLIGSIPAPTPLYDFLLPSAAEQILRPAFTGYLPIVDLGFALLIATVGTLSLLFGAATWANEHGTRIALPIMLAVGAVIALALILIALILVGRAYAPDL